MTIGINNGLSGTIANGRTYDNEYPNEGQDNPTAQWEDNNKILQVGIENLQTKQIEVTGDVTGISLNLDSGIANIQLVLSFIDPPVLKAGDTMIGDLTLFQDPINNLHATTKQYVDTEIVAAIIGAGTIIGINDKYDKAGGPLSGNIDMTNNRINNLANPLIGTDALNKLTADNSYLAKGGGTILGNIALGGAVIPVNDEHLINKGYVDTAVANLIDTAPGTLDTLNELAAALGDDANFASTITSNVNSRVLKSGDTMSGQLVLNSDPTINLGAATKQYVDNNLSGFAPAVHSHIEYLELSGGTMAGSLILGATLELAGNTLNSSGTINITTDATYNIVLTPGLGGNVSVGAGTLHLVDGIISVTSSDQDILLQTNGLGNVKVPFGYTENTALSLSTKGYVDQEILTVSGTTGLGTKVSKTGDNMSGNLTFDVGTNLSVNDIYAINSTAIDEDITLHPKGTGLIRGPFGYDVVGGPDDALVNKGYADTEIALQVAAKVLAVKNHAEAVDDITINNKHQLIVYGEYIIELGGAITLDDGSALIIL